MSDSPAAPTYTVEQLSQSPSVWLIHDFLSPEECDHLISIARDKMQPSTIVDPKTGKHLEIQDRSSTLAFLALGLDPVVSAVETRIANLIQIPVENGEGLQVLRYEIGQEYKPHFDFFDPILPGSVKALEKGGQRTATLINYLNDVEEGGETTMPEIKLVVKPKRGSTLLFYNVFDNGMIDKNTLHSSIPVSAGEKWVATKWIRQSKYG